MTMTDSLLSYTLGKCYDPMMQTEQIVALLITERNRLNAAIEALRGPTHQNSPALKAPAAAAAAAAAPAPAPVRRRKGRLSAAGRRAIGEAAKKRWAAIRAAKASGAASKAKAK